MYMNPGMFLSYCILSWNFNILIWMQLQHINYLVWLDMYVWKAII